MTPAQDADSATSASRRRQRYWVRRLWRNVLIAIASSSLGAIVFFATGDKPSMPYRWSMATGYASVALIAMALALGPWRLLRGRRMPASTDLRRDIGLWGAAFAFAHVVTGLEVHAGGRWARYFFWPRDETHAQPLRLDAFGLANWTGLVAMALLLLLAVISNDLSLRSLGTAGWKRLQQWAYAAGALVALHGVAYQLIDRRAWPFVAAFAGASLVVVALQLRGRRLWHRQRG